jgi:hypothetical protein
MVNPHLGKLVISLENDLGIGKIVDSTPEWAAIEYFDSPNFSDLLSTQSSPGT